MPGVQVMCQEKSASCMPVVVWLSDMSFQHVRWHMLGWSECTCVGDMSQWYTVTCHEKSWHVKPTWHKAPFADMSCWGKTQHSNTLMHIICHAVVSCPLPFQNDYNFWNKITASWYSFCQPECCYVATLLHEPDTIKLIIIYDDIEISTDEKLGLHSFRIHSIIIYSNKVNLQPFVCHLSHGEHRLLSYSFLTRYCWDLWLHSIRSNKLIFVCASIEVHELEADGSHRQPKCWGS